MLAGGLNAENVSAAIAEVRPYAVDVSSGVEQEPGVKSAAKIEAFIAAVGEPINEHEALRPSGLARTLRTLRRNFRRRDADARARRVALGVSALSA